MKREDIELFLNQNVKLVQDDGFVLYGTIQNVTDDSVLFSTDQKTSLIAINYIKEIVGG